MYLWRKMTQEQRQEALAERKRLQRPWHGPPHHEDDAAIYLITAACYEHRPIIGLDPARMAEFERELLEHAQISCQLIYAWVILPNHYHLLVHAPKVKAFLTQLGKFHGSVSYRWNGEDDCRGRQVWYRAAETAIKSDRHFWATMNYVLNDAVRYGYVERWQDWPYSSAAQYLDKIGHELEEQRWRDFPVLDYGKDWDPPEL
jgi:REP-associated tyrosine transposase